MKEKLGFCLAAALLLCAASSLQGFASSQAEGEVAPSPAEHLRGLEVRVEIARRTFIPGEIVPLRIVLFNPTSLPIVLPGGADVERGSIRIFLDRNGEGFREYVGPGWGIRDVAGAPALEIPPQGTFAARATLLYNYPLETGHLSALYATPTAKLRVATEYAFSQPGVYRIQALLTAPEFSEEVASRPVRLTIEEPRGSDLEVWNRLKSNPEYGYFLQTGSPKGHPDSQQSRKLIEDLEALLRDFPATRSTSAIRPALTDYAAKLRKLEQQRRAGAGE